MGETQLWVALIFKTIQKIRNATKTIKGSHCNKVFALGVNLQITHAKFYCRQNFKAMHDQNVAVWTVGKTKCGKDVADCAKNVQLIRKWSSTNMQIFVRCGNKLLNKFK